MCDLVGNRHTPIYLNIAGAGRLSDEAISRVHEYHELERKIGAYEAEQVSKHVLEDRIYRSIGTLIGCNSIDVAIFDSATRAWIEVIKRVKLDKPGILITTPYEYAGNLQILRMLANQYGHDIATIPLASHDELDLEWLQSNMSERVRLISAVHIPSNCGIVNPVEDIGRIVAPYPAIYIVDACQSVGQRSIDVRKIRCDALTAAGRKFLSGPRGTGFAYVSPELRTRLKSEYVDLHCSGFTREGVLEADLTTARALELSERNCAALTGLEQAVAESSASTSSARQDAFQFLREEVTNMPGIEAINPGRDAGFIFTFRHASVPAGEIVQRLHQHGITAWRINGSHTPLYMLPRRLDDAVRLSSNNLSLSGANRVVAAVHDVLSA